MRFLIAIFMGIGSMLSNLFTTLFGALSGKIQGSDSQGANSERNKKATIIVCIVLIVSLVSLWFTVAPHTPKINRAPFIGLGEVLAEETAKAIGNSGTVVPVITTYHTTGNTPMTDEWKTFAKEIKRHSGMLLAEPVIVKLDDSWVVPSLSHTDFDKLVKEYVGVDVIVFFVGLPVWEDKNPLTLPRVAPKIIAVHNIATPVKQYFTSTIATALITSRIVPDANAIGEPKTPHQWFNRYFQVFTAQNYQSLPTN